MRLNTKPSKEQKNVEDAKHSDKKQPAEKGVYAKAFREYKEKAKASFHPNALLQSNKFFIILLVILLFAFISANSRINTTAVRLRSQIQTVTGQINSLEGAIAEEQERREEEERLAEAEAELTDEEEEVAMNDAKTQGSMVAYLQNQYDSYFTAYEESLEELEEGDSEGEAAALNAYREQTKANQEELAPYFDNNGQTNGLTDWTSILATTIPGSWEFATNAAFEGETAPVLWLCYANDPNNPDDHSLLGYCTADYNAATKLFTNVDVQVTRYAQEHATNDSDIPNEDEQPLVDQLQELADEPWVSNTSGDFDQETLDTNASLYEARQAYKDKVANGETDAEYDPKYDIGIEGLTDEENTDEETVIENDIEE